MKTAGLVLALLLWPLAASAHTHMVKSEPASGSSGPAPGQLTLQFAEPVHLTLLGLKGAADTTTRKLGPLPATAEAVVTVSAPPLKPGPYTILWRALGDDGHVMSGSIPFVVAPR